ncbi:hypothetical protein GW590_22245 [Rahnella sp. SAP-1]|uniref:Shiga toxin A subunit n=1 Tax=Rouxiella aceris TaxID=2703884 RepID=A0A848MUM2_9GAMM|nr:hypothetical protein [Rouxiella aceris]NMP29574.1 hypothetical protein [Rouxiella aceris]
MKIMMILFLTGISFNSLAVKNSPCAVVGSADIDLMHAMRYDWGTNDDQDIIKSKTKITLIDNQPVSKLLAEQMAKKAIENLDYDDFEGMKNAFMEYNPRNLIVRYSFVNKEGKENILIGSSIVNDEECSVTFNGYITVKREF